MMNPLVALHPAFRKLWLIPEREKKPLSKNVASSSGSLRFLLKRDRLGKRPSQDSDSFVVMPSPVQRKKKPSRGVPKSGRGAKAARCGKKNISLGKV